MDRTWMLALCFYIELTLPNANYNNSNVGGGIVLIECMSAFVVSYHQPTPYDDDYCGVQVCSPIRNWLPMKYRKHSLSAN